MHDHDCYDVTLGYGVGKQNGCMELGNGGSNDQPGVLSIGMDDHNWHNVRILAMNTNVLEIQ